MKRRLKARIVELYGTEGKFAEALGVSRQTVTNAVRGKSIPHPANWTKWAAKLETTTENLYALFFEQTV